ncbi:bifunctional 3-(3-hydroxy-phenyl)propionate/3-hydroxycinnamic acid hydroxylase [Actinomadura rubrisoli]|uniref:Bifunctional 3-(3-hydroxy-phenyl)propionate/3-hydroxycinnamic acid hydroxylase n=1 Tax=Actinomadura rubrisoli TaxID=2530368 RepID=A0A4R5ANB4_9ACTN|nr:bifunctional 3-(3-hydroxy-phenyl)propionate/3-hydroxycinnamic acid hydroxylase [Actinomadura rubrisoli]TDD74271.1 bifunctional 3-(3-hydroxy-phenyl)propionate/3-hydroxycinnamic acid hydroxylase [Actinomadura rubrisoli]
MTTELQADVAIVGHGPIGQTLAALLAQRGRSVVVVERWERPYALPRAVAYDGESARILASAGIDPSLGEHGRPLGDYVWRNRAGEDLLNFTGLDRISPQGWPMVTSMYQPGLEDALIARGAELPGLRVLRGYEATEIADRGGSVRLIAEPRGHGQGSGGHGRGPLRVEADWLVGCDGANSFVRSAMGTRFTELGFSYDWLICDITPTTPRDYVPDNLQICDPARPRTSVAAGPGHRRWEFMRVGGETAADLDSPEAAWKLLAQEGETPENATLDRHAVYTFKAGHAAEWRKGRLLLAGDAAHLMPPFAGQGMCSGFRDAANLAWKLDLVLAGLADDDVLDTYTEERREHVQHAILRSVELGRVICEPDPGIAARRDAEMTAELRAAGGSQQAVLEVQALSGGLLHATGGDLAPNGTVGAHGTTGRFDEIVGTGFALISADPVAELLDEGRRAFLEKLGAHVVHAVPAGARPGARAAARPAAADEVIDVAGAYTAYLAGRSARAMLVRPDFAVFGTAASPEGAAALIDDLSARLAPRRAT